VIQQLMARVLDGHDLTRAQARDAMQQIMQGEATQAQIAGFLVALRAKGETADEIAGCAEAMREHVLPVQPKRADLVDTAGTGGDGKSTLNISTAAGRRRPAVRTCSRRSASTSTSRRSGSRARSTSSASASCSRRRTIRR
jgi:thymidine phosphorylase